MYLWNSASADAREMPCCWWRFTFLVTKICSFTLPTHTYSTYIHTWCVKVIRNVLIKFIIVIPESMISLQYCSKPSFSLWSSGSNKLNDIGLLKEKKLVSHIRPSHMVSITASQRLWLKNFLHDYTSSGIPKNALCGVPNKHSVISITRGNNQTQIDSIHSPHLLLHGHPIHLHLHTYIVQLQFDNASNLITTHCC